MDILPDHHSAKTSILSRNVSDIPVFCVIFITKTGSRQVEIRMLGFGHSINLGLLDEIVGLSSDGSDSPLQHIQDRHIQGRHNSSIAWHFSELFALVKSL